MRSLCNSPLCLPPPPSQLPLPSPPPLPSPTHHHFQQVTVDNRNVLSTVHPRFKSWNIDASANRGFFWRNLSDPQLHYLAKSSAPGFLRFGGTGNDHLTYAFGSTTCGGTVDGDGCLNETHFRSLMEFAEAAGTPMIFGLNILHRTKEGDWDSSNARELITFAQQVGYIYK